VNSLANDKSIIDNPADEIDSSSFFDEWNIKNRLLYLRENYGKKLILRFRTIA